MANKVVEEATIKNTIFSKMENGTKARIAGLVNDMDVKETAYAPVTRFRGNIAVNVGEEIIVAKNAFFPPAISLSLQAEAKKLKKWESFEFSLEAIKSDGDWKIDYKLSPREEKARALTLLEIK